MLEVLNFGACGECPRFAKVTLTQANMSACARRVVISSINGERLVRLTKVCPRHLGACGQAGGNHPRFNTCHMGHDVICRTMKTSGREDAMIIRPAPHDF